jgi:hypothetical protein
MARSNNHVPSGTETHSRTVNTAQCCNRPSKSAELLFLMPSFNQKSTAFRLESWNPSVPHLKHIFLSFFGWNDLEGSELCQHVLTHSHTHGAEPFLRSCQLCSYSRSSQHFMEPGGSLTCSQEPSTGPYPEPDRSNPYYPILSLKDPF